MIIPAMTTDHLNNTQWQYWAECVKKGLLHLLTKKSGGGQKRLPKFKFSVKFPIGLHMILQIQIKKFENAILCEKLF